MARLQLNIDDKAADILEQLARRSDKALFVEMAIKKAYANKAFRELFPWAEDVTNNSSTAKPDKNEDSEKPENNKVKKKINFDKDFS